MHTSTHSLCIPVLYHEGIDLTPDFIQHMYSYTPALSCEMNLSLLLKKKISEMYFQISESIVSSYAPMCLVQLQLPLVPVLLWIEPLSL